MKDKLKPSERKGKYYRSLWISDVHLGTEFCKAEYLEQFLKTHQCDTLYLVGDIVDAWAMKSRFYWPQSHTNVVRKILTKSKRGTKVVYVTGNHDEFLRKFVDFELNIGNISIVNEAIHETADGRKLLVTHGDLFDIVTRYHKWLAFAGDRAYDYLLVLNRRMNTVRQRMGMPYWSLSAYVKHKVKLAVNFISEFEEALAYECRKRKLDGVVCGHIHHAEIRDIDGVSYHNCGDWVESCTALAEREDGSMEVIHWADGIGREHESNQKVVPLHKAA
ncbi:MAG: UDP-2,3-diacylglucosamine diphosphatase [Nevskiales bacterium]